MVCKDEDHLCWQWQGQCAPGNWNNEIRRHRAYCRRTCNQCGNHLPSKHTAFYIQSYDCFFLKYSKNSNITFQSAKIVILRIAQGCNRNSEGHVHMTGCVKTAKKHVNFAGKVRLIFK